ncbi:hypothetical protein MRB53_030631 [Persea americana]|uniref:Uncharacterized protein n=1 Tax=Persea americana TaxID=3435 RepID=A0ACC2KM46_PERAE|nr:hypothetical protein MRB53_030631 [Persea americana]
MLVKEGEGWDNLENGDEVEGIFTIPLELAYGESRSPSTIPPNAIAKGKKWGNPKELDEVLVKYETRLEDGTMISKSYGMEFTIKNGKFAD